MEVCMKVRSSRIIAVTASVALIVGAFTVGTADAAKKKKKVSCAPYVTGMEAAAESPLVQVTEAATAEKPIVVEFDHPASLVQEHPSLPDTQDEKFVNIQVVSKASSGLYVKEEFTARHDIDLYLYNGAGEEVASSGAFNAAPLDVPVFDFDAGGRGGETFESITGFEAAPCEGYTAESRAYTTPGTPVKMTIWLGEVIAPE
jgi:hypothetical protein